MKTRQRKRVTHALAIQPREVSALWRLLQARYSKLELSAICSDGSVLETDKVEDLLAFDNPGYRRIQRVELSGRSSYDERCDLELRGDDDATATLSVQSKDDKEVLQLTSEVVNLLREARPGWSALTRYKASTMFMFAWLLYSIWSSIKRLAGSNPLPEAISRLTVFDLLNLSILVGALFLALLWPIDKAHGWLFPRVFFLIGRQEDEWKRRARWRSVVFVGFAVSALASLFASLIFERFK